jgi:hypothetical protein
MMDKILGWVGVIVFFLFIGLLVAFMAVYKISIWWLIGFLCCICVVMSFSFSQWVKFFKFVFSIICIGFVGFALYSASPTNILIGVVIYLLYSSIVNQNQSRR